MAVIDRTFRVDESVHGKIKVDAKDEKILALLAENARMSISDIAKKIHLSKEATFYRIKKLQERNIVLGFYPLFDLEMFGYHTFHVFMVLNETTVERKTAFLAFLIKYPNTKSVMEYSDRWDLEWVIVARNVQEFDSLLTDVTKDFSDMILEKQKFEIIIGQKSSQLPYATEQIMFKPRARSDKRIDAKQLQLCAVLADDARQPLTALGQKLELDGDTVKYRIKNLCESGVIRQFSILPNLSLLGYHWLTMCIEVKTFDLHHELKFKEYISNKPQIIRAVKTLGNWDLMLHIVAREVVEQHMIVKELQKAFADIIITYQTWGGYKEYFFTCLPSCLRIVYQHTSA